MSEGNPQITQIRFMLGNCDYLFVCAFCAFLWLEYKTEFFAADVEFGNRRSTYH